MLCVVLDSGGERSGIGAGTRRNDGLVASQNLSCLERACGLSPGMIRCGTDIRAEGRGWTGGGCESVDDCRVGGLIGSGTRGRKWVRRGEWRRRKAEGAKRALRPQ